MSSDETPARPAASRTRSGLLAVPSGADAASPRLFFGPLRGPAARANLLPRGGALARRFDARTVAGERESLLALDPQRVQARVQPTLRASALLRSAPATTDRGCGGGWPTFFEVRQLPAAPRAAVRKNEPAEGRPLRERERARHALTAADRRDAVAQRRRCVSPLLITVVATVVATFALAACTPAPAEPPDAGTLADSSLPLDVPPDAPPPYAPDLECPGATGCTGVGDGVLYAGVATVDITPTITICTVAGPGCTETLDVDANGDGEFDEAEGDTFHDWNGNGRYDGVWMAGFGNARGATGVLDPQWVRAIALRWNDVTIVMASVDVIGWFSSEMDVVRERVRADATLGAEIDFVLLASTHVHQARDVIGIYGVTEDETGLDPAYNERVRAAATTAVLDAVRDLRPANLERWSVRLRDVPDGGVRRYISDVRHPVVFDDEVNLMRFVEAGTATASDPGTTIATLVNLGAHPECLNDENTLLSSDFVHQLRVALEDGVTGPTGALEPGLGGTAVFFQGALGGQIGPGAVEARAWDGTPIPRSTEREAFTAAIGDQIGWYVLQGRRGMFPTGLTPSIELAAALAVRTRAFLVTVENRRYHVAILQHIFDRVSYGWDMSRPISATNLPRVRTEVSIVDIGGTQIITAPGELDPILFLGGLEAPYDYTPAGLEIIDTTSPNPPDLSMRPVAPFLRDLARTDADQVLLFGLAQDFVGYLVPEFDYELHPVSPYYDEAPGDHYEETNSVGVSGWPTIRAEMEALLAWPGGP